MSNHSDRKRGPQTPLTAKERQHAWYEHMKHVLAQNPSNRGCVVLMRNNGRTYKFTISINGAVSSR